MNTYFFVGFAVLLLVVTLIVILILKTAKISRLLLALDEFETSCEKYQADLSRLQTDSETIYNRYNFIKEHLITFSVSDVSGTPSQVTMRSLMKLADKIHKAGGVKFKDGKSEITILT